MNVAIPIHYFQILWSSKVDGPGVRTVVFLQGCNQACPWCHSPHSQSIIPQILFFRDRCLLCKSCSDVCKNQVHLFTNGTHKIEPDKCTGCGECVKVCPTVNRRYGLSGALALPVQSCSPEQLFNRIYPQLDLLRNIGGLTISGGEPLLQYQALKKLLVLCKENKIHTAIESSLAVPAENIRHLSGLIDTWLAGLRPLSKKNTGMFDVGNFNLTVSNLAMIAADKSCEIIIRTPVIMGITDTSAQLARIAEIMNKYGLKKIELLPFNRFTSHYYEALGREFSFQNMAKVNATDMNRIIRFFDKRNITATVTSSFKH